ncbi:hypothetical protein ACS0TY_021492 [Phlomoides rotata]
MASGGSGQQNFRKAICAIKDSTSVGIAKVNSEYKDIKVSILKATNHDNVLPKEKHVRAILGALSGSRPRADVAYSIDTLTKRLIRTHSWVVALKALIVIHRALREVDHSFCEELIYHNQHRGHLLNLLHFKDDSSPTAWDYSTWIRTYALYIEECLECFRVLKYDFYRDHSRTKKFGTSSLLEQLPALQQLLFRLLCCQPVGAARYNFMIQYALSIIVAESVRLYVAITDGVLILVDKFFEMPRRDAVRALEIYRKAGEQAQRLSEFFEMCRSLEFGRRQKYVKIDQPPASFLATMEEYIKEETPQQLMLPWTVNDDVCVTPKLIANLDTDSNEEGSHASDDSQDTTGPDHKDAPPLIPDLLSWDEPSQEAPGSNAAAPEESSNATPGSELSSEPASWELALVTTPGPDTSPVALTKGGVLDISVLDSLYNTAQTQTNTNGAYHHTQNASSNPFEADPYADNQNMLYNGYNQNMPYDPSLIAHPMFMQQEQSMVVYDYKQIEGIPQQQPAAFAGQYYEQQYLQISGIPQQQPALGEQHHQREPSFTGLDFTEMPQQDVPLQQQEDGSAKKIGNPFVEQSSLPVVPQNDSSNFNLL